MGTWTLRARALRRTEKFVVGFGAALSGTLGLSGEKWGFGACYGAFWLGFVGCYKFLRAHKEFHEGCMVGVEGFGLRVPPNLQLLFQRGFSEQAGEETHRQGSAGLRAQGLGIPLM